MRMKFSRIEKRLTSALILELLTDEANFIIYYDASRVGLGAVLM